MQQSETMRVILSGGGTGGHIFPAVAIAHAIRAKIPSCEILFVGAKGRMEMEKVPAAGFKIIGLTISGLQRKLTLSNLSFPFKVLLSLLKARKIIKSFGPDVVIGTGGYASGPTLRAASWLGIPILIQEQNSFPGITNKILSKKADVICVAYPGMDKFFPADKIRITGNPVRKEIEFQKLDVQAAKKTFHLDPDNIVVLVVGGSLGARTLNQSLHQGLKQLIDHRIQVIWQTGKSYAEKASEAVRDLANTGIQTFPFISDMDQAYQAADIVVSRAGAIAISELCILAKPAILVPSPNVTDDHQTKNALALASRQAAIMISDHDVSEKLIDTIIALASDKEQQKRLKINIRKMAHADAAFHIAELAIEIATKKK